jgi:catechol 2,3-dioxygenase-like lactoylglutathione lyase family enzyme
MSSEVPRRPNDRHPIERSISVAGPDSDKVAWPQGITAVTLFVEDLEATKTFYREAFGLPVSYEDDASAVFTFGETMINLLKVEAARALIEPAEVGGRDAGSRFQFTIPVGDELLNGPMDRPWGIRTASFRDPGGHIWEIAG